MELVLFEVIFFILIGAGFLMGGIVFITCIWCMINESVKGDICEPDYERYVKRGYLNE